MPAACTYGEINSYRESSQKPFFCSLPIFGRKIKTSADVKTFLLALPLSAALGFKILSNVALRVKRLPTPALEHEEF